MLISVIIPAYNEEKIIQQSLERLNLALDEQRDEEYSWEIIVCDNNSSDKTVEIATEKGATIVKEPFTQILSVRNRGARAAQGEWIIFMDADSYLPPAFIAEVFGVIEKGNNIGCGTTILVKGSTLFNKLRIERMNPFYRSFNISGSAFVLCQREAFRAVNGFSTHLYA